MKEELLKEINKTLEDVKSELILFRILFCVGTGMFVVLLFLIYLRLGVILCL